MKTPILWFTLLLAATLAASTRPQAAQANTSEADQVAIRNLVEQYLRAWNASDLTAIGAFFAEDVVEMRTDGAPFEGRKAVLDSLGSFLAQFKATQSAPVIEVGVEGNLAFARGTWSIRLAPKAGGAEATRTGTWMTLFKRQADESWKIWRWIWNEQPAAAPKF
jgi:uncharacterized protein (TIGR02246 family)